MIAALRIAAQVAIVATAPADVRVREPFEVKVEVTAPPGTATRVVPPELGSFELVSFSRTSVSTGGAGAGRPGGWDHSEYRYVLMPTRAGGFVLQPFQAQSLRATAFSRPLRFLVRDAQPPAATRVPAIVSRARMNPSAGVNFHALVLPETVYVGQQATYQVGVFLDNDVRLRLRRNPEFLPPELRSMLAYDLPAGRAFVRDWESRGRRYDVHVFQRAIFPLAAGRYDVPPAQLVYSLPITPGFFSREESHTARSEPLRIVALAPPAEGRPVDYGGAVGQLSVAARFDSAGARVGDPLVLTVRVEGTANVKLLPRPRLELPWASAVASDERVRVDSTALIVRGVKEFDWILTPRRAGVQTLPAIRYPFFDPYAARYETAETTPATLTIAPGALVASSDSSPTDAPLLAVRQRYAGPVSPPLPSRAWYWVVVLLAPLPAVAIMAARRPQRAPRERTAVARLRALASAPGGTGSNDARELRRAFAAALAGRLALPRDAVTRAGAFARALRRRGVSHETAVATEALLGELDAAAYSASGGHDATAARRAHELYGRVDAEAREQAALAAARTTARAGQALALLACVALAGVAGAALAPVPEASFREGLTAYASRDFAAAHRAFAEAAAEEPSAPDAWANAGTAAWIAGDTAAAVEGWQRAARLDPLGADDVRARLELVAAPQHGRIAAVPRVPVTPVAAGAALLWCTACALAALRARGGARVGRRTAHAAAACAVAATAMGLLATVAYRGRIATDLAVVAASGPLRIEPALAAELGPLVNVGDVARTLRREAAWTRVQIDGDREGWIETERLRSLGAR